MSKLAGLNDFLKKCSQQTQGLRHDVYQIKNQVLSVGDNLLSKKDQMLDLDSRLYSLRCDFDLFDKKISRLAKKLAPFLKTKNA